MIRSCSLLCLGAIALTGCVGVEGPPIGRPLVGQVVGVPPGSRGPVGEAYDDGPREASRESESGSGWRDLIEHYNKANLEYNERLVRQKQAEAALGDEDAREWLRQNEWRVVLVRQMYDAAHPNH